MDKEKILAEIERLLKPIVEEQATFLEDQFFMTDRYHRIGGQISVLNNLKHKIIAGIFDKPST